MEHSRGAEARSHRILDDIGADTFFEHCFQKMPFAFDVENAGWVDTVTLDDVDHLVASLAFPDRNWIFVVKNGAAIAQEKLTTDNGYIDLNTVYQAYRRGYSLQLAKVHRRHEAIGRLARALELQLLERGVPLVRDVSAHLYLTPPRSTGLPPHYDNHDVIILQLDGVKQWRIYEEREKYPLTRQSEPAARETVPPLHIEVTARPGNVLYIPRGWFHEATAADTHSLHLTLSVCAATWLDLLVPLLQSQTELRAPLPPRRDLDPAFMRDIGGRISGIVSHLATDEAFAQRFEAVYDRMWDRMDALPDSGFRNVLAADELTGETLLRRGEGTQGRVRASAGQVSLCFSGARIAAPEQARAVFEFLRTADSFAVDALPDVLDRQSKLTLARDLVRSGFLRMA